MARLSNAWLGMVAIGTLVLGALAVGQERRGIIPHPPL